MMNEILILLKKYDLDIKYVVRPNAEEEADKNSAYLGDGIIYNSEFLDGLNAKEAKDFAIKKLAEIKSRAGANKL